MGRLWTWLRTALRGEEKERPDPPPDDFDPFDPFPEPVRIEFSDVLDLHPIPPRMIRTVVEDYLEEAHRRGVRWVRLIHGKGIGVQREAVRALLRKTAFVVDFRDAPPEAGGHGATVVTLSESGNEEGGRSMHPSNPVW